MKGLNLWPVSGQDKLTRDRIRTEGVFSASVVSEALLPAADFCGTHPGYEFDKSEKVESEKGGVLNVPVPKGPAVDVGASGG